MNPTDAIIGYFKKHSAKSRFTSISPTPPAIDIDGKLPRSSKQDVTASLGEALCVLPLDAAIDAGFRRPSPAPR